MLHLVLSLDIRHRVMFTGGADRQLIKATVIDNNGMLIECPDVETTTIPTQGISSLKIRSDGRMVICGCWDGK